MTEFWENDASGRSVLDTAHHEAAHAVVQYRASGFVGGTATIVPDPKTNAAGQVTDFWSDSGNSKHAEARLLSIYAGAFADRRRGCYEAWRCAGDDEIAEELLAEWAWEGKKFDFKERSRQMVEAHWNEIVAVAEELLICKTLDDTEIMTIADIAAGEPDVSIADLENYRLFLRPSERALFVG